MCSDAPAYEPPPPPPPPTTEELIDEIVRHWRRGFREAIPMAEASIAEAVRKESPRLPKARAEAIAKAVVRKVLEKLARQF